MAYPRASGGIAFAVGSAQTDGEVNQFEWVVDTYRPRIDVIMAPLGLELDVATWDHVYIADGSHHGDVVAGVWRIGMRNQVPIHCVAEGPVNKPLRTIRDRYRQCGINPCGDGRGVVDMQEAPYFVGLEVWIRSDVWMRTLSLNSHIRPWSLSALKTHGANLPWCWEIDDIPRTLSNGETCAVLGNALRWKEIDRVSSVEIYTQWRPTPLGLRKKIPGEVFGTYDLMNLDDYQFWNHALCGVG